MRGTIAGAIGFGTRLPIGHDQRAWRALADRPGALVLAAVPTAIAGSVVAVPVPAPTAAVGYVLALFAVGGITHLDGLADCADAAVAHGTPAERRAIVADTRLGVGGTAAVALAVLALAAGGLVLADAPPLAAIGLLTASEAAASLAMVAMAVLGRPATEGLGATVIDPAGPADAFLAGLLAAPLFAVGTLAGPLAVAGTIAGGAIAAIAVGRWAGRALGGPTGDVLGASHAIARVVAVHLGVIAWTVS